MGNISSILDSLAGPQTQNFAYDALDRLTAASTTGATTGSYNEAYAYDPATGNLAAKDVNASAPPPPNPGTTGLNSWWSLDETSGTRYDSHGPNHLTDNNTVNSAIGVKDNAADFEKDNYEYLSRPSSPALQMSTSDIYVGAWVKAETLASYPNIISKLGPDGGREFNLRVLPTGVVDFTVYDGSNANYTTASKIATITLGQWYYVEGWTDKANRTVYVNINNGTPASATWAAGINRNGAGSSPLLIGARAALDGGIGEYWDGLIDEAVYYKRGLNASERTWLYNNGAGRIYSELTPLSGNALNYSYTGAHAHAVTALGTANSYGYDANGNMTCRVEDGVTYKQDYDAENRLTKVQKLSGDCTTGTAVDTTQFVYDGDGNRVKSFMGNTTTVFVGNYFEATTIDQTTTFTKYYFAGTQRVAMRKYTIPQPMTVEYMLGDHLGSTSITADSNGARISEIRYNPWGEMRAWWTSGEATTPGYKLINYTFTGQYSYMDDPTTGAIEGFGLMFYNARFYSPYINHFISADTIIPDQANPQSWNRYSYVTNNPLRYTDPTGHRVVDGCSELAGGCSVTQKVIDEDKRKANKFRQRTEYLQCWGGDAKHCSELDKAIIGLDNLNLGDGTIQIGVGTNGFISGLGIRGDISLALDFKGNVALVANGGGGGYIGAGGGLGPFLTVTNAPSVNYLKGNNVEYGGQIGNGVTVATEVVHFIGQDRERYSGLSISGKAELLAPWSFEGHGTATHSAIWGAVVNLPDLIVDIFCP